MKYNQYLFIYNNIYFFIKKIQYFFIYFSSSINSNIPLYK